MTIYVTPVLRLVPNGLYDGQLHMTLIATPMITSPPNAASASKIKLEEWPTKAFDAIFGSSREIEITIGHAGKKHPARPGAKYSGAEWLGDRLEAAWKNIVSTRQALLSQHKPPVDLWQELINSIMMSLSSSTYSDGLPKPGDNPTTKDPDGYVNQDGAYTQSPAERSTTTKIKAVLPVKHGDLALLLEFERAARVLALMAGREFTSMTNPTNLPTPAISASLGAGQDRSVTEKDLTTALRTEKLNELKRAIEATQSERVKGATGECKATPRFDKQTAAEREKRWKEASASHVAGSWAQAEGSQVADQSKALKNRLIEEVLQAYQAIVSSPAWSRIFGFAYDITVDWDGTLLPLTPVCAEPWQVPITDVPVTDAPTKEITIWTFLDKGGWPAAKPGVGVIEDGLFRMGTDCTGDVLPRFDAVTLDVRQAAEAAARPLDVGPNRGFQTAGMTLVDRRRAEDVRAQIARTGSEKSKSHIYLFADDILIGRRLDVGVLREEKIEWRALGGRSIDYGFREYQTGNGTDFGAIKQEVITDLLGRPDGGVSMDDKALTRTVEHATVNAAARVAPSHTSPSAGEEPDKHREVFVEEAFATWEGAAMGVHSGGIPTESTTPGDGPKFPFLQRQNLPAGGKGYSKLELAPPLRYGSSYRFGMRAVFLGGRSKTVNNAADLYNRDIQEFTYPRDPTHDNHRWPLRRFVRQEAIGAPSILLPASMLDASPGEMDFEQAQSAVLRSVPPDYKELDLPKTVRGRLYTRARERVSGDETVRIFVPPVTAMDNMLRASCLDDPVTRSKVVKGGLLGMAYGVPAPLKEDGKDPPEGGFPMALIEEKRAFGAEPTRRNLKAGWSKSPPGINAPAVRGTSIFIAPSALNAKMKKQEGVLYKKFEPRPYYPDPHATRLILRLRRRSNGQHLEPVCEVQIYDSKSTYPDAMPVALAIQKAQAGTLTDRWSKPKTGCFDGISFDCKDGQRIQKVQLFLEPGDDFDLEAFYLPDAETLATKFALIESMGAFESAIVPKDPNPGVCAAPPTGSGTRHVTTGFYAVPEDADLLKLVTRVESHLLGTPGLCINDVSVASAKKDPEETPTLGPPIEDLAALAVLRVAHAVNRPFRPASFPHPIPVGSHELTLRVKRIDQVAVDPAHPSIEWDTLVAKLEALPEAIGRKDYLLHGQINFDRNTTSAVEIVAACVSPREPLFDDPARKRSLKARVAGAWPQKTESFDLAGGAKRVPAEVVDVYGFDEIDSRTGNVKLKRSEVILLRIDNIAGPGGGALARSVESSDKDHARDESKVDTSVDLGLAHLAALLGQAVSTANLKGVLYSASQLHTFPDGKARKLEIRLRAVSRFATDFETAPRWASSSDPEVPVVRVRQPLHVTEQWHESAPAPDDAVAKSMLGSVGRPTCEVWLPSSQRPDKCAPLAPIPVFRLTSCHEKSVSKVIRTAGVRIYLERGWYSSGEGELLGVILPSVDIGADKSEFLTDDELGPLGPFISRWGGDPIKEDFSPLTTHLGPEHFSSSDKPGGVNKPIELRNAKVPVQIPAPPGTKDPLTVLMEARLLTYLPRFDVDREQWFVDLDLAAPETPNLLVRLGLVRFQENAMRDDLQVSEPVVVWTQLLPKRELSAVVEDLDDRFAVHVSVAGNVHKDVRFPTAPKGVDLTKLAHARQPEVHFRLVHESNIGGVLRRISLAEANVAVSRIANSDARWDFSFNLFRQHLDALEEGSVYVYAEERELYMPANYDVEPVSAAGMFDVRTLKKSGPKFAARLEIELFPSEGDGK